MRKLLLIITCLAFVSCSKDDDPATEAKLSGEWELTSQEQTFYDGEGNEYTPNSSFLLFDRIRFKNNGRGDLYIDGEWHNNVLIAEGDQVTINHEIAIGEHLIIKNLSSNSLTLTFNGKIKAETDVDWVSVLDCSLNSTYKRAN